MTSSWPRRPIHWVGAEALAGLWDGRGHRRGEHDDVRTGGGGLDHDIAKALRAARAIRAGTVWVSPYNVFAAALPFGGFKASGFGREMGSAGLDLSTEVKSVWVDLS